MSKVSQRKRQAYQEGRHDAINGNGVRYSKHPFMIQYKRGYHDGWQARNLMKPHKTTQKHWFARMLAWVAAKVAR